MKRLKPSRLSGISPVVGAVLLLALTVVLSAIVGTIVFDQASSVDSSGTGTGSVRILDKQGGYEFVAIDLGKYSKYVVLVNGSTTNTTLNSVGDRVTVTSPPGSKVTVVGVTDSGDRTVMVSKEIDDGGPTITSVSWSTSSDWSSLVSSDNMESSGDSLTSNFTTIFTDGFEDGGITEYREAGSYGDAYATSESGPNGSSSTAVVRQWNGGGTTYKMVHDSNISGWNDDYTFRMYVKSDNFTSGSAHQTGLVLWRDNKTNPNDIGLLMFSVDANGNNLPFKFGGGGTNSSSTYSVGWSSGVWYTIEGVVYQSNNTAYAKTWKTGNSEPSSYQIQANITPSPASGPTTIFSNGKSSIDLDIDVASYRWQSTVGHAITGFKSFSSAQSPSTLELTADVVQGSDDRVVAYVESDTNGDGTVDETSDPIVLSGSSPYSVTGLSSETKNVRVRIEVRGEAGSSGPTVNSVSVSG